MSFACYIRTNMWCFVIFFSTITILLLAHEVFSNLHVVGNDVLHHHHKHTETRHKHYMYPVPVYYHEGPKPHLHPYPYHIDGEPPAAHVHRDVRPIPINKKRRRRRIGRRKKRHGKRPVLQIPVIHHHHPPDVVTEPPIYQSALRNLLATPVSSLAGNVPSRRRSSPVIDAPAYRRASAPMVRMRPTVLQRSTRPVVRRASNLRSAGFNSVIHSPVLSRPPSRSSSRLDNVPIIVDDDSQSSYRIEKRPILQSSFLKQSPYSRSSIMSSDASFDHLPIIEDDSPVIYETGGQMESSFFEDGPPILTSSIKEEYPFRKSSMKRSEQFMDSDNGNEIFIEKPFLEDKRSSSSYIMDHKQQERPPFMEDKEGPTIFGSSNIRDSEIFMDEPSFMSDHKLLEKSSMFEGGIIESSEEYKPFKEYKPPTRKSSIITDDDLMESLTGEKLPSHHEIIMDDDPFKESSFIRDKPFMNIGNKFDGIYFMDDENVPFKRSVKKDGNELSQNDKRDLDNAESRYHTIISESPPQSGLFDKSTFPKDQSSDHIYFDDSKKEIFKLPNKDSRHDSSGSDEKSFLVSSHDTHDNVPSNVDKNTFFLSESSHEFSGHVPYVMDNKQLAWTFKDKTGENFSFDKELESPSKLSHEMTKHIFDLNENSEMNPWDVSLHKKTVSIQKPSVTPDQVRYFVNKNPISKPAPDYIHFEKDIDINSKEPHEIIDHSNFVKHISETSYESPHENSDLQVSGKILDSDNTFERDSDPNLKSSNKLYDHIPNEEETLSPTKLSPEMSYHISSVEKPPTLKSSDSFYAHVPFEKDIVYHSKSHHVSTRDKQTSLKYPDKFYDHIPFEKDVPSYSKPSHEMHRMPYHFTVDHSSSSNKFFDHIPFDKDKVTHEEPDGSLLISDHESNFSNQIFDKNPFYDEKERKREPSYKVFKHISIGKDEKSQMSKPLKLARIKDNKLEIPLIADLPKPFNINKISASSVSDRGKSLQSADSSREEKPHGPFASTNKRREERPGLKPFNNVDFKNVDFKDVKALTSNKGGSTQGRHEFLPERD